jgi:hypothetical protein
VGKSRFTVVSKRNTEFIRVLFIYLFIIVLFICIICLLLITVVINL